MKKHLFVHLSLFVTLMTAHAGEYSVYQRIQFQKASTWVAANKTCVHGSNLYHQTKDAVFVSSCDDDENCPLIEKPLVQPIVSKAQRCAKSESDSSGGDCLVWEPYTLKQGPVVKIFVYESQDDEKNKTPKKVIPYEIPNCLSI